MLFETIPGSTGTIFSVVGKTAAGKVAVRDLSEKGELPGFTRVRVVRSNDDITFNLPGWKSPQNSTNLNRYSTVVPNGASTAQAVATAMAQLVLATKGMASSIQKRVDEAAIALQKAQAAYEEAKSLSNSLFF